MIAVAALIVGAVGAAAGIFGTIVSGVAAADQLEFAKEQQRKLEKAQAKVRAALETYQSNEKERIAAMRVLNGEYDEATAKRIADLAESLNAANDAFSIDSQAAIDNYIGGIDSMLDAYENGVYETDENGNQVLVQAGATQIINNFSTAVNNQIKETALKNLAQLNMTADNVNALIDQFSADTSANIANYTKETGAINQKLEQELDKMIAEYDASQAGRNQALKNTLTNASEEFKQAVQKEAAVREKVIGDNLKLTGQVLANTNEGVSEILGVTPEQNLQRAQQAATDFAVEYAETAGTAAGNQAQQAARQSGLTKGAAALMGATAATNATTDQFGQAAQTGLSAYQGAQAAQVKALEDQYARQRELAQEQMNQARLSEEQNAQNADKIARLESENAKYQAQMSQQDELEKARQKQEAAQSVATAKQEAEDKTAEMEKERITKKTDESIANEKELGQAVIAANNKTNDDTIQAAKDELSEKMGVRESAKQTQENALNKELEASQSKATQEHTNATNAAATTSNEQKEADTNHYINELSAIEAERQSDFTGIDTNMNLANQQAGISNNASGLAASAASNFSNQVGNLGNNMISTAGNLANTAAMQPAKSTTTAATPDTSNQ